MDSTNRCPNCQKKMKLMTFSCKCNIDFCINCRDPSVHNCTFDYKEAFKEILTIQNPIIVPEKINKY